MSRCDMSPHTCDVTSLDWDEHNISCFGTISLFIWSHMMRPQPIRDQELGRKSSNWFYGELAVIKTKIPSLSGLYMLVSM